MRVSANIVISLAMATASTASPVAASPPAWGGWQSVKNLFVFGDSYTQTGFNVTGTQPNPANPFGNPPYPGWTTSNGPNWPDFLTTTYNTSFISTFDLAQGGATVDSNLVAPYKPGILSLKDQVETLFLPTYGKTNTGGHQDLWDSADSLFALFFGINDVGNSWSLDNATLLYDEIFTVYNNLLEQLHAAGAQNFLFLSVPPVNLAPLTLEKGDTIVEIEGNAIKTWNEKLANTVKAFGDKTGTRVIVYDTWELFNEVIQNPGSWEQTQGLKDVTGYCEAYENGTTSWYTKDPSCEFAVNEYLWLNNLHPTFPVHNATAASIVKFLNEQS